MKVLVTGVNGQVGIDVVLDLKRRGYDILGVGRKPLFNANLPEDISIEYAQADITDEVTITETIINYKPHAIIHCAAWTAVDDAELIENKENVYNINYRGTEYISKAAKKVNSKLLYVSTDYVFDGRGEEPWIPDQDSYYPLNEYGKSKYLGENVVKENIEKYFIVRISWVFGLYGKNFVKTMLDLGKRFDEITVINDQFGNPTYTKDLARLLVDMIETENYGIYHATNEGDYISWYDFATEIFKIAGMKTKVLPITSSEFKKSLATRPYNSRLDKTKLTQFDFKPLPDWKDATARFIDSLRKNEGDYNE